MRLTLASGQRQGFLILVLVLSLLGSIPSWPLAQEDKTPTRADLEEVATESIVELTTIGRRSGQPRTKPIWFVYDQGRLYLQSGKGGKTDWYQNLQKNPHMTLTIASLTFAGTAKFVTDPAETERVHALFRDKYLTARLAGMIGSSIGHGEVVEVELPF